MLDVAPQRLLIVLLANLLVTATQNPSGVPYMGIGFIVNASPTLALNRTI